MLILQDRQKLKTLVEWYSQFVMRESKAKAGKQTDAEINTEIHQLMGFYFIDTIDRYIEHRIEADETLIGILADIQGNLATIADHSIKD